MSHGRVVIVHSAEEWERAHRDAGQALVVAKFTASWCGPCRAIEPVYVALSKQYTEVTFLEVDVDQVQDVAMAFRVSAMPTFMFFRGGRKLDEFKGADRARLEATVRSYAAAASGRAPIGGSMDPYTGSGAVAAPPVRAGPKASQYFPTRQFLKFEDANFDGALKKLTEFHTGLAEKSPLTAADLELIQRAVEVMKAGLDKAGPLPAGTLQAFAKVLRMPLDNAFPGLDLLRMLILHDDAAKHYSGVAEFNAMLEALTACGLMAASPKANMRMCLRVVANMFASERLRPLLIERTEQMLEMVATLAQTDDRHARIALATVLHNYSIICCLKRNVEGQVQIISILTVLLPPEQDPVALFRLLVCIGNMVAADPEGEPRNTLVQLGLPATITKLKSNASESVQAVASDLTQYLR